MKTIKENIENTIIINKSKFITNIFKINNEVDIKTYLKQIETKYNDATHHCYAYIINNTKRFNDDKEPSGTAGMPILTTLEHNEINNILCIVTRYFGGIKLGANGLIRAYTKSTKETLNKCQIVNLIPGKIINITFNYEANKTVDNILKEYTITNKTFNENITYQIMIPNDKLNKIKTLLQNNIIYFEEKESLMIEQ